MLTFLSLPLEIRLMVYKHLPWPEEIINPYSPEQQKPSLPVNSLYTNKTIYHEYRQFFYSHIPFDFTNHRPDRVAWFLDKIGPENAKFIRHIYISLPTVIGSSIDINSDLILDKVQKECTNLKTISLNFVGDDSSALWDLRCRKLEGSECLTELVELLDKRFRRIASLDTIFVEMGEDAGKKKPRDGIFNEMVELGWKVGSSGYLVHVDDSDDEDDPRPDEDYIPPVNPFADTCVGDRRIAYTEWPDDPEEPEDWDEAQWDEEANYGGYVDPGFDDDW